MPQPFPLVLIGANSLVAPYVMQRLSAANLTADVISRRPIDVPKGCTFTQMDLTQARNWIAPAGAIVISMLPLWVLAQFLPRFIGVKAIIATGSTSLFSKAKSVDANERSTALNLEQSEEIITSWCQRSNVQATILRSTMIYDGIRDNNIARMARFIKRYRVLPLAAPANGLRQPIHADDVAHAIVKCVNNEAVSGKHLNIAGGEIITYREMVERVFAAANIKPRLIMLPTQWLQKSFQLASKTGLLNEKSFGSSIFQRMNEDLIFDTAEGLKLLDYQPRNFHPQFPA